MSQPKGSMCASCKHSARDCSSLPFSYMRPVKRYPDGTVSVICTGFERKHPTSDDNASKAASHRG